MRKIHVVVLALFFIALFCLLGLLIRAGMPLHMLPFAEALGFLLFAAVLCGVVFGMKQLMDLVKGKNSDE